MLTDHNRMAAYHSAICGNSDLFKDKIVMDVGTGSGILAVWAAQAGAKRVYAVEYTDMARHARNVVEANGVGHIVTVIQVSLRWWRVYCFCCAKIERKCPCSIHHDQPQGAVEDIVLPESDIDELGLDPSTPQNVDIIISEWMGYFLLRESMLDSLVRARDKFLKPATGIMMPSHATMMIAPIVDEEERRVQHNEFAAAMEDWKVRVLYYLLWLPLQYQFIDKSLSIPLSWQSTHHYHYNKHINHTTQCTCRNSPQQPKTCTELTCLSWKKTLNANKGNITSYPPDGPNCPYHVSWLHLASSRNSICTSAQWKMHVV